MSQDQTTTIPDHEIDVASTIDALLRNIRILRTDVDLTEFERDGISNLVKWFQHLDEVHVHLKKILEPLAERIALFMTDKKMVIEGVTLERSGPTGTVIWDDDNLITVIKARASDERRIDRETGEALETETDAFIRVFMECARIDYWRVGKEEERTGLKGRGIDPDEYRTQPSGPRRAKVVH